MHTYPGAGVQYWASGALDAGRDCPCGRLGRVCAGATARHDAATGTHRNEAATVRAGAMGAGGMF